MKVGTHLKMCAGIDVQISLRSDGVPFAGDSLERSYLFYDRPSRLSSNAPACRGQSRLSGVCCAHRLCVRSPCQRISRMRTFDNNSCAISITSPRSLFRTRTQHGRWGHREKSRRASTRWDCRGKSCLAGLSPLSGTPSERRVCEKAQMQGFDSLFHCATFLFLHFAWDVCQGQFSFHIINPQCNSHGDSFSQPQISLL